MTAITRITLHLQTSAHAHDNTDGLLYLGVGGREFRCDTSADDLKRGASDEFVFGDGSNVKNPEKNDPRHPQLILEEVDSFPVYLRFEQVNSPAWLLSRAQLHFDNIFPQYNSRLGPDDIWLGIDSGKILFLRKHIDPGVGNTK